MEKFYHTLNFSKYLRRVTIKLLNQDSDYGQDKDWEMIESIKNEDKFTFHYESPTMFIAKIMPKDLPLYPVLMEVRKINSDFYDFRLESNKMDLKMLIAVNDLNTDLSSDKTLLEPD